jgi:hypothetical protein
MSFSFRTNHSQSVLWFIDLNRIAEFCIVITFEFEFGGHCRWNDIVYNVRVCIAVFHLHPRRVVKFIFLLFLKNFSFENFFFLYIREITSLFLTKFAIIFDNLRVKHLILFDNLALGSDLKSFQVSNDWILFVDIALRI